MKKSILLLTSVATSLALTAAPVAQTSATLAKKASPKVSLSELTNKKLNTRATSARTAGMPALKSHPVQSRSSRIATPKSAAGLGQLSYRSMFRAPAKVADANCDLYGFMTYDATWSQEAPGYGLYDVNPNSPEYSLLWPNSENVGTTAFYAHGKIYSPYAITFWGMLLGQTWNVIDAATGLEVSEPTDLGTAYSYYAMTYVPKMGGALALVGDNSAQDIADAYKLARVDLDGSTTILADLDTDHLYSYGLTVGPDGDVYGLTNNGALYKINVSDFSATLVKDGVVDGGGYISALAYDKDANLIYYPSTPEAGNSFLFGINPTTGEAEARYDFGHQVEFGLLYLPAPALAAGAPAAASALNADFAAGALSGNVTFKAPEVDSEGNALSGTLNYTVTVNGTELAPGTCAPGADVTVAASVPKGGYYDICVVCSNAAGAGAEANIVVYLGPDVPAPVANLALAYEDGSFKLTWDAAKGVHDGFVDQSKVVYTVTRYVNNVASVVSENQAATSFTEAYAEPASMESVFYTVKVSYDGNESVLAKSNSIVLGAINPPYFEDFASASAADFYTIIDSNNDEYTWAYSASEHAMEYTYSTEGPAEDYLVFPAMKLEAGKVYTIGFDAGCQSTSYPEKFIFYAGNDATEAALTDVLIPETEVNTPFMDADANLTAKHFEANYVAKTTGLVYFAVKAVSDADMWSLYITNVSVSEGKSAKAPAVVSDLTAQADPTGAPTATISFTCPTTSIDGENLTSITSIEVIKGDEVVKTISNPAPGSAQSVVDSEAGQGNVTYTVIASNEQGEGLAAKVTVFVGFDVPAAVQNLSAANGADYGEVVLTWDPVTQDINGLTLPEESYNVYIYNASAEEWDLLAEGLSENTYSYRACAADAEQDFAQYAVSASNEQGAGQGASSGLVCIGKPYSMPYVESFDLHSILGTETISDYPSFGLADDATVSDLTSADQDNAYMYMQARYANTSGRVFTGKISVGAMNPSPLSLSSTTALLKTTKTPLMSKSTTAAAGRPSRPLFSARALPANGAA